MTATALDTPPVHSRDPSCRPGAVIRALTSREGWRLIRHPAVVAGILLAGFLLWVTTHLEIPVLYRASIELAATFSPLAAGTLLAANLATLRARRHDTEELFDTTPVPASTRTFAHLLAVGWPTVLSAVLVTVTIGYLYSIGAIGHPNLVELAVVPTVVALAGATGVALARWAPSVAAGPLTLVVFGALHMILLGAAQYERMQWSWLGPIVVNLAGETIPGQLLLRPAGWHLAYLAALAAIAAAVGMLSHGRRPAPVAAAALGLVVAVVAAAVQVRPPPPHQIQRVIAAVEDPSGLQRCERRDQVVYCAFSPYLTWVPRWDKPVRGVLERLPAERANGPLQVRQLAEPGEVLYQLPHSVATAWFHQQPGGLVRMSDADVTVGTHWGRGQVEGQTELLLALGVARWAVGLPADLTPVEIDPDDLSEAGVDPPVIAGPILTRRACSPVGQAREVVALWLAAQATPGSGRALRLYASQQPFGEIHPDGTAYLNAAADIQDDLALGPFPSDAGRTPITWTRSGTALALQLLDRDADQVTSQLTAQWARWTDPVTTTEELIAAFDLQPLPTPEQSLAAAGITPDDPLHQVALQLPSNDDPPSPECR